MQRRTRPVSRRGVTRWNSCFFATATVASHCRSRKRFYFSWNLSRNGSSKKFHETDHVTRCHVCWNLFRSAVAHKFQLKVSACNGGLNVSISFLFLVCFFGRIFHFLELLLNRLYKEIQISFWGPFSWAPFLEKDPPKITEGDPVCPHCPMSRINCATLTKII